MKQRIYITGDDDDGDDVENANKRLSKESEGRIILKYLQRIGSHFILFLNLKYVVFNCSSSFLFSLMKELMYHL